MWIPTDEMIAPHSIAHGVTHSKELIDRERVGLGWLSGMVTKRFSSESR